MEFTGAKETNMYNQMCNKCEDLPCENMDGCEAAQEFLTNWKPVGNRFTVEKTQELLRQCNNMVQMYGTDRTDGEYQEVLTTGMLNYSEVSRELCLEVLFYLGVEPDEETPKAHMLRLLDVNGVDITKSPEENGIKITEDEMLDSL